MVSPTQIAVAAPVRDGRVLLAHRHPARRWYPDCWDLVGGHVEAGELPEEAVVRECVEELGVLIHDPRPFEMPFDDPTLDMRAFVVTRWDGEPANLSPDEHDGLRWFDARDLPSVRMAHPAALPSILNLLSVPANPPCAAVNGGGGSAIEGAP